MRSGSTAALPTDRTFTGQKQDGTGLLYYNARYYDSALGTFVSPDTIVPEPGRAIDYNRFAYTRNNPLRYMDPSGHIAICFEGGHNNASVEVEEHYVSSELGMSPTCQAALQQGGYDPKIHGDIHFLRNGVPSIQRAYELILEADRAQPVIIMGYSWGGAAALDLAQMLNMGESQGGAIQIDLLYLVEPELNGRVLANLDKWGDYGDDAYSRRSPKKVARNVISAFNLDTPNPSQNYESWWKAWLQDGTGNIKGATTVQLTEFVDANGNIIPANHQNIVWSVPGQQATIDQMAGAIYSSLWLGGVP